jgi:HTH-type transcriptional regulator, competence development regulator
MAQKDGRGVEAPNGAPQSNALGAFIRKARQDVSMSLRDVVLHALSQALSVDYEALMQRAGYLLPTAKRAKGLKHGRTATFAIDNLTADEESQLLEYLTFLRTKKK